MFSSNCCFLTYIQTSQEAGQVVWYSHLFQNFPQFIVIHTVKAFVVVNKAEVDVSLELSCFFDDTKVVGNLISGSSAFSKTNFNILKFMVHILLKTGLENFEHYVRRVQLCSSLSILWLCLSLGLEWKLTFPVGHRWVFQVCWHIEYSTFTISSFRTWNSDGQGGLVCCRPWGCKELDMTEWLNWTDWTDGLNQNRSGDRDRG